MVLLGGVHRAMGIDGDSASKTSGSVIRFLTIACSGHREQLEKMLSRSADAPNDTKLPHV